MFGLSTESERMANKGIVVHTRGPLPFLSRRESASLPGRHSLTGTCPSLRPDPSTSSAWSRQYGRGSLIGEHQTNLTRCVRTR